MSLILRPWFAGMVAAMWIALPALGADFDADGNHDLLFRDRGGGMQRLALVLSGTGTQRFAARAWLPLGEGATGFAVHTGDFDGDGHSDILDRDLQTGRIRVRLMDGERVRAGGTLGAVPLDTAVALEAIADVNGDGRDDLVFRDGTSGAWKLRLMRGLADHVGTLGVDCGRDPALRLVEAADFDRDGRADLLLRHATTLAWSLCRLNGKRVLERASIGVLPRDPRWLLQASADMNRDGVPDLLFRHRESGAWYVWFLRGGGVLTLSGPAGISSDTAWRLQAFTDVNGDRYPDALLLHPETGEMRLTLLMERWRLAGSGAVALPAEPAARLAASGDFSAGGGREMLYRDAEGQWSIATLAPPGRARLEPLDLPGSTALSHACRPPRTLPLGAPAPPAEAAGADAFLAWTRPVTRANGDPLCAYEIAGYVLSLRSATLTRPREIVVGDPHTEFQVLNRLAPGRWWFSIRAMDLGGLLSPPSAKVSKIVR